MALTAGNDDIDVDGGSGAQSQNACFASTFHVPFVAVSDCSGGLCGHGNELNKQGACSSWCMASQELQFTMVQLGVADPAWGVAGKGSSGSGGADAGGGSE